ncbi:hypothetical protein K7N18_02230 [Burkholderia arboris]|jgi:hypothetical protein|uniref:hypothetical protein n=1 Tax=Burkholderia arboris TaxID=488730 RepID=UPI001CA45BAF|nr:hypothetical protein [Burkholderia arboris]MBY8603638.1 hypothetical protein [Burkholderia arboris]
MTGHGSPIFENQSADFLCNLPPGDRQSSVKLRRGQLSPDAAFPDLTHINVACAAPCPPARLKISGTSACEARPSLTAA